MQLHLHKRLIGKNVGGRLFVFFGQFATRIRQSNGGVQGAWRETLVIPEEVVKKGREVNSIVTATIALDHQLTLLEHAMDTTAFPQDLYLPHLNQLRKVLDLGTLNQGISAVAPFCGQPEVSSLHWCSIVLPDDGELANSPAMEELAARVRDLRAALGEDDVPEALRRYASGVLVGLEEAMSMVPIQGSLPLGDAVRKAVADAHFDEESIKADLVANEGNESVANVKDKLSNALKKAAEITGNAEKLSKGAIYLFNEASKAINIIKDIII